MQRRDFMKSSTLLSAATIPFVGYNSASSLYANVKGSDIIKVGLIGCGGRGTGAVCNMIEADQNIKIVAMADLFADKFAGSKKKISDFCAKNYPEKAKEIFDVNAVKTFSGWDCCDQLLKENVDVVIEATPPVFRTPHYAKIVSAGKHAFLEKPVCIDVTQACEMIELSKKATEKGLCVVCGNQRRYSSRYQDIIKRVQDGEIGEIVSAQCCWNGAYYIGGYKGFEELGFDSIEYQIRKWGAFIWTSGDHIVEQHVHNIDVIMWALGDRRSPIEVRAWGGRSADPELPSPQYGDRFSHFSVDFDMGDGLRFQSSCQQERKTSGEVFERIIGTKGIMYTNGGCKLTDLKGKIIYMNKDTELDAYVAEHKYLLQAIRKGARVNRLDELLGSNMLAIAGRMSAYSGKKFKYDWFIAKSKESLAPKDMMKFGKNRIAGVPVPGQYRLI